jgi:hypothetical protein
LSCAFARSPGPQNRARAVLTSFGAADSGRNFPVSWFCGAAALRDGNRRPGALVAGVASAVMPASSNPLRSQPLPRFRLACARAYDSASLNSSIIRSRYCDDAAPLCQTRVRQDELQISVCSAQAGRDRINQT